MKNLVFTLFLSGIVLVAGLGLTGCGDDDTDITAGDLAEAVKGTWIKLSTETDCPDDEDDFSAQFPCEEQNCSRIILGDSTFVTRNLSDGNEFVTEEFYVLTVSSLNTMEICDGVSFDRTCRTDFRVEVAGSRMTFTDLSNTDDCITVTVYQKEEVTGE